MLNKSMVVELKLPKTRGGSSSERESMNEFGLRQNGFANYNR